MGQESKKLITCEALLIEIQGLLDACKPECNDLYVELITLHNTKIHGCNWTVNILRLNGAQNLLEACESRISEGIKEFQMRFDIVEKFQKLSASA